MKETKRRSDDLLADGVTVFFLWGFAVAQPLFDLLARRAEFFVVRRSEPLDILLLTGFVSILMPAALALIEWAAGLLSGYLRRGWYLLVVATLVAATVLLAGSKVLPFAGWMQSALALAVGIAGTVLYARYSRLRESRSPALLTLLTLGALIFPASFLLNPSISKLLWAARDVETGGARVDATTPVVMVIFDELSVVSLMDERREIDRHRFPNFSALAQESTWYRNATTVSDNTIHAVPAILTGKYPRPGALPEAQDHSPNLFTWLGSSYDLNVIESQTHLCPVDLCRNQVVRPRLARRFAALLSDLSLIYCHVLLPKDLAEDLPSVEATWEGFWDHDFTDSPEAEKQGSKRGRVALFRGFIDSIQSKQERVLYYAHVSLPHIPWEYLLSGQRYGPVGTALEPHGILDKHWSTDAWHSIQAYQRYLLQVGFTDKLLGELLDKLKEVGLFDRSLIIVTADHGVSFRPGANRRGLSAANYPDIMSVPLLIKYPQQGGGEIDDANVQLIDIAPTVADALGLELPWPADGRSILRESSGSASNQKITYYMHAKERWVIEDDPEEKYAELARQIELFGTGADRDGLFAVGEFKELIGHRIDQLEVGRAVEGSIELDGPDGFANVDLSGPMLPAHITGEFDSDTMTGDVHLAVAVNGVVRAVTRSYRDDEKARFSAMIPPDSLIAGSNRLELFAIALGIGEMPRLARLSQGRQIYRLGRAVSGYVEAIMSPDGRTIPVRRNILTGRVLGGVEPNGEMKIRGWATDSETGEFPESFVFFANGEFLFAGQPNRDRRGIVDKAGRRREASVGFNYVLPTRLLSDTENPDIRIFALLPGGYASEMRYAADYPWRTKYKLATRSGAEVLQTTDGASIPVDSLDLKGGVGFADIMDGQMILRGWAVDVESCDVAETLVVFANGKYLFSGAHRLARDAIGERYGEERMRFSGFSVRAPLEQLEDSEIREVRVFAISRSGTAAELSYPVDYPWNRYSLAKDGGEESLLTSAGRSIAIIPDAFQGRLGPVASGEEDVRIRGWITEAAAAEVLAEVALFADGELVHAVPFEALGASHDLVRASGEGRRRADFHFVIPKPLLPEPLSTELRIFAVSRNGYASELQLPSPSR